MTKSDFLEEFYGQTLPVAALDAFVVRAIDQKNWDVAADGYETKWFGYRTLTPGQCLFVFADRYRRALTSVKGRGRGSFALAQFKRHNVLTSVSKRYLTGFWSAMAIADSFGIPYDFYCKAAIEYGERKGWRRLPSPTQIYNVDMTFAIKAAWQKRLESGVMVTTANPAFSVAEYEGDPWQDKYMAWLIDQALSRPNPKYSLVKVIFTEPQVTERYARDRLGDDRFEELKKAALSS